MGRRDRENAERIETALRRFGFDVPELSADLFVDSDSLVRMGVAPWRIEVLTDIAGVDFADCRERAFEIVIDGVRVPVIALADLRANKLASGRAKDLADLDNLPEV